jgi:Zn2+/Cd2+-exporting ATPase
MDCAACASKISGAVERLPGVSDVKLSAMSETLSLSLAAATTSPVAIEKLVHSLGYTAAPVAVKETQQRGIIRNSPLLCGHNHGESHDHLKQGHEHDHNPHAPSANVSAAKAPQDSGHGTLGNVHEAPPDGMGWWRTNRGMLVVVTGCLLVAAWGLKLVVSDQVARWGFIAACLIGVAPIAKRAFVAARAGVPFTIEMLMSIAAAGAMVIGAAEEAALVVFLFAVGEVLESLAANKARASIKALGNLIPKTAIIEDNGVMRQVEAAALAIGQTVLVRPGDRIPADGDITDGTSGIDESPVTGESMPKSKAVGDAVFAGSINTEAALRVKVTRSPEDNTISRIIRLVEEAQDAKAPTERFIDRFSRIYMPAIVALALMVMLVPPLAFGGDWNTWVYRSLALLLIGCPCALVISVPASIASALSAGARRGLLMKGGVVIEAAARTTVVAFDKTGTLTAGRPQVTDVVGFGASESDVLMLAAAVETGSSHPLAEAILGRAKSEGLNIPTSFGVRAIIGKGVEAKVGGDMVFVGSPRFASESGVIGQEVKVAIDRLETDGKTVAAVFQAGRMVGLIALRDEARVDAAAAVSELKELGVRSIMLTGDNARTGATIAASLGMDCQAELMPDDKVNAIKKLAATDGVMMVGDGINDAPALAAATVGIAMGSGTDVALETADGALLRSRVMDVARMIRLSRATMSNIRLNITIALGLKAVFLVTSVLGYTGLWVAILADTGATVIVTLNALRLLAFNPDHKV